MTETLLPLAIIRLDGGTQSRAETNLGKIAEYAERMEHGDRLPPVTVFHDGQNYWLADGFQRVEAAEVLEWDRIAADVLQGTQRDAILFSVGANAKHGQPRSAGDTRRAVRKLLDDPEWRRWSDRDIAKTAVVSHDYVSALRAELYPPSFAERKTRMVDRGGTTFEMDVSNIGRKPAPPDEPPPADVKPGHREHDERPRFLKVAEAVRSILSSQRTLPDPRVAAAEIGALDIDEIERTAAWWTDFARHRRALLQRAS